MRMREDKKRQENIIGGHNFKIEIETKQQRMLSTRTRIMNRRREDEKKQGLDVKIFTRESVSKVSGSLNFTNFIENFCKFECKLFIFRNLTHFPKNNNNLNIRIFPNA